MLLTCGFLIVNSTFMTENPKKISKFMTAVKRAANHVLASLAEVYKTYIDIKPEMASAVNAKVFEGLYAYFFRDFKNLGEGHQVWGSVVVS